jgi:hypothetical protein
VAEQTQKTYAYLVLLPEGGVLATHFDKDVAESQAEQVEGCVGTVVVTKDCRKKDEDPAEEKEEKEPTPDA